MARGGIFQALGNLWRWTIWGLAAVLVLAIALNWSGTSDPEGDVMAEAETPSVEEVGDLDVTLDDAPADEEETAVEETVDDAAEAVENTLAEVQSAVESAVSAGERAASEAVSSAEELGDQLGDTDIDTPFASDGSDGVVGADDADLNILAPEMSDIRVPGDEAVYSVVSMFRRDDGIIEVVSERTVGEDSGQTIRLVTCAPLAVGVVSEGDGPRNDAPELERIPLGSAAATIAALACGAMN